MRQELNEGILLTARGKLRTECRMYLFRHHSNEGAAYCCAQHRDQGVTSQTLRSQDILYPGTSEMTLHNMVLNPDFRRT